MRYLELREEIVEYGKRMSQTRLSTGTSGNLSIYLPEENKCSLVPAEFLTRDYGRRYRFIGSSAVIQSKAAVNPPPSGPCTLPFMPLKPQARVVLHARSTYCTVFSCLREPLVAVHYGIAASGATEVPCAEYATFGTRELAIMLPGRWGILMPSYWQTMGSCVAPSLAKAFSIAEEMEFLQRCFGAHAASGIPLSWIMKR